MNNLSKQGIRRTFDRAARTYDAYCSVQQTIAQRAIRLLLAHQQVFDRIVDFGCGTGESTACLMQHVRATQCYAVDFSEQLLSVAKHKLADHLGITWIHGDFDQPISFAQPVELIFSNMALQWSSDVQYTLDLWNTYLAQRGLLLFSVPIAGNFSELKACYRKHFLSDSQMIALLSSRDGVLMAQDQLSIRQSFTSQYAALTSLKATGTNYHHGDALKGRGLARVRPEIFFVDRDCSQLTYHVGIYLIRKTA